MATGFGAEVTQATHPNTFRAGPWDLKPAASRERESYRREREIRQVRLYARVQAPPIEAGPVSALESDQPDLFSYLALNSPSRPTPVINRYFLGGGLEALLSSKVSAPRAFKDGRCFF